MGEKAPEKNVTAFASDVKRLAGYAYTSGERASSRFANQRLSDAVLAITRLKDRTVLDVGCGDGTYTLQLLEHSPKSVLGIDPSDDAVECAKKKISTSGQLKFEVCNVYALRELGLQFDVAIVRGVIHHLYEPEKGIAELLAVANEVVVIEPNGYNPVLKLIERTSKYHIAHEERSYPPMRLNNWFKKQGGAVTSSFYAGLVPFFCPDWFAKMLKAIEPIIERIPLLRALTCAVYVFKATRKEPLPIACAAPAEPSKRAA